MPTFRVIRDVIMREVSMVDAESAAAAIERERFGFGDTVRSEPVSTGHVIDVQPNERDDTFAGDWPVHDGLHVTTAADIASAEDALRKLATTNVDTPHADVLMLVGVVRAVLDRAKVRGV